MKGRSRLAIAAAAAAAVLGLAAVMVFAGSRFTGPLVWAAQDEREQGLRGRGAYLGVRVEEATDLEEGGARVADVIPDSPAEEAGIEEGDVIVRFGGEPVRGPIALTRKIRAAKPSETVELEIVRDGEHKKITVELGERTWWPGMGALEHLERLEEMELVVPDIRKEIRKYRIPGCGQAWMFRFGGRPKLGVELVQTTPELREFFGGDRDTGVLVGRVMKGSAAEKAGIRVGDLILAVDGEEVRDAGDILEALEDKDGERVEVEVLRDRERSKLVADIPGAKEEEEEEPLGPRAWLLAPQPPAPPRAPRAVPPPSPPGAILEELEGIPPEEPLEDELTAV